MEIVSQKLGLHEQLEIIKIIDPDARLLPTDTEFFIGIYFNLSNAKFNIIYQLFK